MNDKFDELARNLAQSVTRRGALKKFGVGLAGFALASIGLGKAGADKIKLCRTDQDCPQHYYCDSGICHHVRKGGPY
jgi:hypothetical protein